MSVDLSLVSVDDMLKELESRCSVFVMAYQLPEQRERNNDFATYYGKGAWSDSVFLSSVLHNDCMNNWNKELVTLQKLNESEEEM